MNQKALIRRQMVDQRNAQDPAIQARADRVIRRRVEEMEAYQAAQHVLLYASFEREIDTWTLMDHAHKQGKRIYLPRVVTQPDKQLEVVPVDFLSGRPSNLVAGVWGIREPAGDAVLADILEFVLVPGLAFTRSGYRIGYGGGYYDRLLAQLPPTIPTVGVCYSFQILSDLPIEAHDQPVSYVITEEECIQCDHPG